MHARVVRLTGVTSESWKRALEERVIPTARQQPGLKGAYWLFDSESGRGLGIGLWEDEEALRASEEIVRTTSAAVSQATGAKVEGIDTYEVVGQL